MKDQDIRDIISEYNPDAIMFDDLNDAIIGMGQQHGGEVLVVYDSRKCIDIFFKNFKNAEEIRLGRSLTEEEISEIETEAVEWFEFNVENVYVGKNTPIFVDLIGNE